MIQLKDLPWIYRMQRQRLHRVLNKRSPFANNDDSIKAVFADPDKPVNEKLDALVHYFWKAHQHYCLPEKTIAYYPGWPSIYGARNDGIEGVTRLLPLWAAYISSPDCKPDDRTAMRQHLKEVLCNGTDPANKGYWGDIEDKSTLICEAADVALALWIAKEPVWETLDAHNKKTILAWLKQVPGKQTADNNWHLFVILVDLVVADLDPTHQFQSQANYQRIKSFYVGDGCFRDGEQGQIDLYNAWGFHYTLFWINQIDPEFDPNFIQTSVIEFCDWYQYLFTNEGVVLFGRSLCYRMAMPAPLLSACAFDGERFPPQQVISVLYTCWRYFIENNALKFGRPTQGIFEDNEQWLDPYSGQASSLWATRALVIYSYLGIGSVASQTDQLGTLWPEPQNRHINISNFSLELDANSNNVTLHILNCPQSLMKNTKKPSPALKIKAKELVYATTCRPSNNLLSNGINIFDSSMKAYRTQHK